MSMWMIRVCTKANALMKYFDVCTILVVGWVGE